MFYKSISTFYDSIFPPNRKQLELIESIKKIKKDETILDIGCATGNLTTFLSEKSNSVTGIDLDNDLLNIAREKSSNIDFRHLNMLKLLSFYAPSTVDRIVSFGNTLVHLPNRELVIDFFSIVYSLLKPGGTFTVQIINYDRIMDNNIKGLPTIDNDKITFKRDYLLHESYVDFNTILTIKENGQIIENSIALLNLRKKEINSYLTKTGFNEIRYYGDLMGGELTVDSIPLIFSCKK